MEWDSLENETQYSSQRMKRASNRQEIIGKHNRNLKYSLTHIAVNIHVKTIYVKNIMLLSFAIAK